MTLFPATQLDDTSPAAMGPTVHCMRSHVTGFADTNAAVAPSSAAFPVHVAVLVVGVEVYLVKGWGVCGGEGVCVVRGESKRV